MHRFSSRADLGTLIVAIVVSAAIVTASDQSSKPEESNAPRRDIGQLHRLAGSWSNEGE